MSQPGRDGFYRCPHKCGDPNYPQPKWKTLAGYDGHLAKCKAKPEPELIYVAPISGPRRMVFICACGVPVYELTTVWRWAEGQVCADCGMKVWMLGVGHWDAAGLELPGDNV